MTILYKNRFMETSPTEIIMRLSSILFEFKEYDNDRLWYKSIDNKYIIEVTPTELLYLSERLYYREIITDEHIVYATEDIEYE